MNQKVCVEYIENVALNYTYYNGEDQYNEGDDVENKVLEVVKSTDDYTVALENDNRWPILYQLSKQRENIVFPMDIKPTDKVLEIGAGMGAVTGAIARRCNKVECIELSKRRSMANAYRNRRYSNIEIFLGNFQDIQFQSQYDVITLIGVFEYAQSLFHSEHPYEDFLVKVSSLLKTGGKVYIAIENKLGMKYFSGCNEDHLGIPFQGIEGYNHNHHVRTFTRSQLESLVLHNGFSSAYFYYPYPDYKLPVAIYSDDYLLNDSFAIPNWMWDLSASRLQMFDELRAFRSISNTEELRVLANSFLVEAIK